MKMKAVLALSLLACAVLQLACAQEAQNLLEPMVTPQLVDQVNAAQNLWVAGETRFSTMTRQAARKLLGHRRDHRAVPPATSLRADTNDPIPDHFDAREKWPRCTSIGDIRDQGGCGDCWAFGAIEPITDRTCIFNDQRVNPKLSATDLVSCCSYCTLQPACEAGGFSSEAYRYWIETGLVTGGEYHTKQGCMPYTIQCCGHHGASHPECRPSCRPLEVASNCTNACIPESHEDYARDKHHGKSWHFLSGMKAMQQEIMQYGPITASYKIYNDFFAYREGIYYHVWGDAEGGHVVKILGWGREPDTENGTMYWLVANSWNEGWGEKGFFRIRRGTNECDIEDEGVIAGVAGEEP